MCASFAHVERQRKIGPEDWAVGPQAVCNDLRAVLTQRR